MKHYFFLILIFTISGATIAQKARASFPKNQISINAFRNPSIGLEYQRYMVSIHAGYYLTNFESNTTTEFLKAGVSYWFLPWGKNQMPSSFYVGSSYLRGLTRDYKNLNAVAFEAGAKLAIWKGLNFRLGVIAIVAEAQSLKINPTPSLNYSFKF